MPRLLLIGAALASFFLFATEASAQLGSPNPVQFTVSPETPAPGGAVLIEVEGVGTFLGDATITWVVDGKMVKSGAGERSLSLTAGPLGSKTTVKVTINSSSQGTITKTFTIAPSTINLLWEADTSVPWWFKGKALYSAGSNLTVTALPQVVVGGKTLSTSALSFQWKVNDIPAPQQSGVGRNSITFAGSQLLPGETASVEAYYAGSLVAQGSITIPAAKPQVFLYERDPLRGTLSDTALVNSVSLSATEVTIEAEPFYFANSSIKSGSVPFAWTLNGKEASGPQTAQGLLTLRQAGSGAGRAELNVELQNNESDKFVQSANTALTILFGGASNSAFSSFFGL